MTTLCATTSDTVLADNDNDDDDDDDDVQ